MSGETTAPDRDLTEPPTSLGPYRALGLIFVVDVDPGARADAAHMLTTVPAAAPGSEPDVRFSITLEDGTDWVLRRDGQLISRSATGLELPLRLLVTQITRQSLDHTPDKLHVHGGTVVHEGRGILVYGPSFAGKSTMIGALVGAGCGFLSDESAAIDPGSARVHGWPKPLSLRQGALELLGLVDPEDSTPVPLQFPATELGSGAVVTETAIHLMIETAYDEGVSTQLDEVHPADAAVRLAANSLDLPRFARGGMAVLGRLAAGARAVRLTHSMGPTEAAEYVVGLLGDGAGEPLPVEELDRTAAPPHQDPPVLAADSKPQPVRSIDAALIGNRVALHDLETNQTAALDEVGSLIWLHLDGHHPMADIGALFDSPEAPDAVVAFVQDLAERGLVAG